MRRFLNAALGLLIAITTFTTVRAVENTWDPSVQVSATVQSSPARITLVWPQDTNGVPSSYTIYRRTPGSTDWGSGTTVAGSSTSYVDSNVTAGTRYEYRIVKAATGYTGYGYIVSGVEASLIDSRGKIVLVVDNTFSASLASELSRLEDDLRGDGWTVARRDVARTDSPTSVKATIKAVYDADPASVKSVFLFGHVPVPYSGQLNPDGHPDHLGAWPADVYYGDMDGSWTDNSVNYTQTINTDPADAKRLSNVPGDGKFDQTTLPSAVELEVGRVDLSNMPARLTWGGAPTAPSELELLRKYLNKDHNFRHHVTNPARRAILGDYFGYRGGEAFAASGFRSFAPLVGASNIRNLNVEFNDQRGVWIPQAAQADYLLAYGCGAGSYDGMSGLGNSQPYNGANTAEMISNNVRGVFNLLFGSWLGDWDHEDNFLRSPLATDYGLASAWSGRPHWFMHTMGLGDTLGSTAKLTQNNNGQYETIINSSAYRIHVALMGDPTLRLHPVVPVSNLGGTASGSTVALSWAASTDSNVVGYHVYRAASANGAYTRLTSSPVTATSYTDAAGSSGATYMVRAVKLETAASGSYYNASQGIFWTVGGAPSSATPAPAPAPATDSTAPTISLSAPAASASISGASVAVTANATDNVAVTGVQFKLDGANLGNEVTSAPFATTLDTTTLSNGTHTLSAVARDAAGNMASATNLSVTVSNATAVATTPPANTGSSTTPSTPTTTPPSTTTSTAGSVVWLDDSFPASASSTGAWNWISSSPAPFSGSKALQTATVSGQHEYSFAWGASLTVKAGESLFATFYVDPANPPKEIMLSFFADNWEHRAYWGSNLVNYGTDGTNSRRSMGALPAAGQWVRVEIPASALGLEGQTIGGMGLTLFDGRTSLDYVGKFDPNAAASSSTGSTSASTPSTAASAALTTWFDDALPAGASASSNWSWVTSNPTPNTGTKAMQTAIGSGQHEYSFGWGAPFVVSTGESLVAYVYLDPANAPREIMLSFSADNWEHRAYWGSNDIGYGTDNTASRRPMGALPAAGQWARLEVPASAVALEGKSITGLGITLFNGRAAFDTFGKAATSATSTTSTASTTPVTTTPSSGGSSTPVTTPSTPSTTPTAPVTSTPPSSSTSGTTAGTITTSPTTPTTPTTTAPSSSTSTTTTAGTTTPTTPATNPTTPVDSTVPTVPSLPMGTTTASTDATTPPTAPAASTDVVWFDDALPAGASGTATGGDAWLWTASNPAPFSGTVAHQSAIARGLHDHTFSWASQPFAIASGDYVFVYVYLDPANTPSELMVSWCTDNWEHRAYWGDDRIKYGKKGTAGHYYAGALPAAGQWVRLEVPAKAVGLEGASVQGMSFSLYDGRATWDKTGKAPAAASNATTPPTTTTPSTSTPTVAVTDTTWFDDALPAGAYGFGTAGDTWNWTSTNPAPYSGSKADQTIIAAGVHETSFSFANTGLTVATGEYLTAYVYLDPANLPSSIMLSFFADNWEHRAYWGANKFNYGTDGTVSRFNVGALPAAGQWVRLEVPAKAVGLEGATITGMSFSLCDGRASWDKVGKASGATVAATTPTAPTTTTPPATTPPAPTTPTTTTPPVTSSPTPSTPSTPSTTPTTPTTPSTTTPTMLAENVAMSLPQIGDHQLTIVSPTMLEVRRITTKQPDPATPTDWNFVSSTGAYSAPATSEFTVNVNGSAVAVKTVGFRRRVAYAPEHIRDLRIDNCLYLELATAVTDGAAVEVKNASGALWPAAMEFKSTASTLRYSPAIHVNQEGYAPSLPKKAMVGYYLGNLGELNVGTSGFQIVSAATGVSVYNGTLTSRLETGFTYSPAPYQKVLEADFSAFTTPGEYQLVVPGLGASFPFLINDGVAMAFTRTYALGIYHQRCGAECAFPYSRFTHAACHIAPAEVPSPQSSYSFTWTTIASKNSDAKTNPRHTAPQLDSEAAQLYPFVNKGTVDVSGGHHDAGDYSKYTSNVAQLVHQLTFTADSIAGAADLDNLGLPQSGDGISDILQEAKLEADYLAKLQDADGGFYFIVYPKTREYESGVTPDHGDQQVVWPKNTSASAAAVAALAQIASSPKFKAAYPDVANAYLTKAKAGWQFLINAIAKYGKDGAYQKVTFYSDNYMHDDELAWAAASLFAATGEAQYNAKLMEWFPNPSDPATFRWGWWRMNECWGNAIRTYAFAARSGRLSAGQLDATYLAKCEEQIKLSGDDQVTWSRSSAYGTSFPEATRHVIAAGWYFSMDQASDMAVAYQLDPKPAYVEALIANMNYEAGTNPVNVTLVTGLGLKRQREIVNQWANADQRTTPMAGIPIGNFTSSYAYIGIYGGSSGNELANLSFPTDSTSNTSQMYPMYDRWADTWNVTAEFITMNQARALTSAAMLASLTPAKSTAWKPTTTLKIVVPTVTVETGSLVKLSLDTTGLDLTNARVFWEGRDNEPDFGSSYTVTPKNPGTQWVDVEVTWADGRRLVGTASYNAFSPVVTWLDDAVPTGAQTSANGGDSWNWTSPASPAPKSGSKVHETPAGTGQREHAFTGAWTPLSLATGDTLFVWVYLDPSAMPDEIMLSWNDGSWEHRAYWGANKIGYGTDGTVSRRSMGALPAGGAWVKLEIPASAVGLEGRDVTGMSFSTYGGGRVVWDAAGRTSTAK